MVGSRDLLGLKGLFLVHRVRDGASGSNAAPHKQAKKDDPMPFEIEDELNDEDLANLLEEVQDKIARRRREEEE
jgi:hypothetical protein